MRLPKPEQPALFLHLMQAHGGGPADSYLSFLSCPSFKDGVGREQSVNKWGIFTCHKGVIIPTGK